MNIDINHDSVLMVSIDVSLLVTDSRVDETTEIISNQIFPNCKNLKGFDRLQFVKFLVFCVKNASSPLTIGFINRLMPEMRKLF